MSLKEYVATLQALIDSTPFVTSTSFAYDDRPPSAGYVSGTLHFADDSQFDFKEFIIFDATPRVIKYGYNYRLGGHLIFRYDNANDPAARQFSTHPHHKHLPSGLVASYQRSLKDVLQEITSALKI